jgi:hypothetical protein
MSSNKTEKGTPELLFDLFYSMISSSGIVINQKGIDNMQARSRQVGADFEKLVEREAVKIVKRLQEATGAGFKEVAKDLVKLQDQIDKLKEK